MRHISMEDERMSAMVGLIGQSGAESVDIGYLHENVPSEDACWYAAARYRGTRIMHQNATSPLDAISGLARKVLNGSKCARCGGVISIDGENIDPRDRMLTDGSILRISRDTPVCRWYYDDSRNRWCNQHD